MEIHDIISLIHCGVVTHICVSKLAINVSDNGLSPGRCQGIIWTNAGILLIGTLETNFSEILIKMYIFSLKKMHFKLSSGNWQPFCLGLNVLMPTQIAKFMGPTWGTPGSCRPQVGPMNFAIRACNIPIMFSSMIPIFSGEWKWDLLIVDYKGPGE